MACSSHVHSKPIATFVLSQIKHLSNSNCQQIIGGEDIICRAYVRKVHRMISGTPTFAHKQLVTFSRSLSKGIPQTSASTDKLHERCQQLSRLIHVLGFHFILYLPFFSPF